MFESLMLIALVSSQLVDVGEYHYTLDDSPRIERIVHVSARGVHCTIHHLAKYELPSTIAGPDVCEFDEFFGPGGVTLPPQARANGSWQCQTTAVSSQTSGDYAFCQVQVTSDPPGSGPETESRLFQQDVLDETRCNNWCLSHWPVDETEPFDTLYSCTGTHPSPYDHPAYTPAPSSRRPGK